MQPLCRAGLMLHCTYSAAAEEEIHIDSQQEYYSRNKAW